MTHSISTPYDSEVAAWQDLLERLAEKYQDARVNPQDLVDDVKEQFLKIGLVVDVLTFSTGEVKGQHPITGEAMVEEIPGLWSFDVVPLGRADKHEFDHDKMAYEVQHNILGLKNDGPGVIKAERNLDEIVRQYTKGHKH
jgi:hypothetical protein